MIRPPRLVPGARVGIVAPSSPVPRDDFAAGAAILGSRYRLVHDERIFARHGFLAGEDADRLAELARALADPSLAAIFFARGGYGIMRILDRLDGEAFARAPKPLIGFSDVTALHAFAARAGVVSIHGPLATTLGKGPADQAEALFTLLESPEPPPFAHPMHTVHPGVVEGPLLGGNLEMIARLVGTPWAFDFRDAILLIEDVGERPYRIDRALTQLILSGAFVKLRGAVVGDFVNCGDRDSVPGAMDVILERLSTLCIPVVRGAPVGHGEANWPVPIGARVRLRALESGDAHLDFLEGAVR